MTSNSIRSYVLSFLLLVVSTPLWSQDLADWTDYATNLDTTWELLVGPGGLFWATQRPGSIVRLDDNGGPAYTVATIGDALESGEAGTMGMAIDTESEPPRLFVAYASKEHQDVRVVRYTINELSVVLENSTVILTGLPLEGVHVGCRLKFRDGKLFVTYGDAAQQPLAQELTKLNGKILRINPDGSAPADNPFADQPYPTNLIWSYGHRNPQGLAFGRNGILYSSEHGPSTDDELNIISPGENYGWPEVHGYCDQATELDFCQEHDIIEPVRAWTPTLAVAGMEYYDNDRYPEWKNSLLVATLKESDIRLLKLDEAGTTVVEERILLDDRVGRLRDICVTADGRIFAATSNRDGRGASNIPGDDRVVEIFPSGESPMITDIQVDASDLCTGDTLVIRPTLSGNFGEGTTYLVEFSNLDGTFTGNHQAIYAPMYPDGSVKVPVRQVEPGSGYKVRLRTARPSVTSEPYDGTLTITEGPTANVQPPFMSLCHPDDIGYATVTPVPGAAEIESIVWSNGVTGEQGVFSDSGIYTATVTDRNGCTYTTFPVVVRRVTAPIVEIDPTATRFCRGDSTTLTALGTGGNAFQWSTGEVGEEITVSAAGTYWVELSSTNGCTTRSEEVEISYYPDPEKPQIIFHEPYLTCSTPGMAYQWYRDGEKISGETGRQLVTSVKGDYTVVVVNEQGCSAESEPFTVGSSGVRSGTSGDGFLTIAPQPVRDRLNIFFDQPLTSGLEIVFYDIRGKRVRSLEHAASGTRKIEFDVSDLESGTYVLTITADGRKVERSIVKR